MDDTEDKVWELFAQRELMRIDGGIHLTGEPQALPSNTTASARP